jgi:hypothetical protein
MNLMRIGLKPTRFWVVVVVLRVGFWHWLDSILALISSTDPLPAHEPYYRPFAAGISAFWIRYRSSIAPPSKA